MSTAKLLKLGVFAVLGLLLAGCSSAPTHFYTLVPPSTVTPTSKSPYLIEVLPVTIPAQVDQPQMVVRQGDDQVQLVEAEQWIAPLGNEIREAFADRLGDELGTHDVYGMPHAKKAPLYRVRLHVQRFDSALSHYAQINATWSVQGEKGPAINCVSQVRQSVGAGYSALVQGHQQAIAALADQVAGVVRQMASGATANCPAE
ncbi:PqiC family protein [Oleiagrimonas sp. C23AA]|uniref:PqiC family protein n=1 Tax=Oleiagrimonas sp. C23AA TaxID=2719047 RepID=UPI001421B5FB|nr:PqiC family protein [Oleiagrimonas sp. C23AA]NII10082.1 membrane integrity-associated transporter subunit PqiC [Oleiagrimonas sp. C23AA]